MILFIIIITNYRLIIITRGIILKDNKDIFRKVKSALTLFLLLFTLLTSAVFAKEPFIIYHAFNMSFKDIVPMVDTLHKEGFDAIQIPPAQQSNPNSDWWARYQPRNYSIIEGRGSLSDLKSLTKKAKYDKMIIIADIVFNHGMADTPAKDWRDACDKCYNNHDCSDLDKLYAKLTAEMPQFKREDFHPWKEIKNGDWDEHIKNGNADITRIVGWGDGTWADFNFDSPNVQKIHKEYLDLLISAGVKGFRFDAEKNMSPAQYKFYVDYIKSRLPDAFIYGENYTADAEILNEYSSAKTPVTDFKLFYALTSAFSLSGNLWETLSMPDSAGNDSITFARNHDTVSAAFKDPKDAELAWAYILARKEGVPLIFSDNTHALIKNALADDKFNTVKAGIKFRKIMNDFNADTECVYIIDTHNRPSAYDEKNLLFMTRGDKGFIIINKTNEWRNYDVAEMTNTPLKGCYKEIQYNFYVNIQPSPYDSNKKFISRWGNSQRGGFEIGPKTALFFVQISQ